MSKWLAATAAVVVLGTGCHYGASAFPCMQDEQCVGVGPGGRCEQVGNGGLCSFEDQGCPSGHRFGDLAGGQSGQCVGEVDAAVDTPGTPPVDGQACFGTGIVRVCLATTPAQPLTIPDALTIDTSDSTMCAATVSGAANYCVIAATSITVNATLRAKGTKPLVLIASDTITVNQLIDVASHRTIPEFVGAGADPATCMAGTLPNGARSGGAGGSFVGKGGDGGGGAAGGGGTGGRSVNGTNNITELRGGCPGQAGTGNGKGAGGHGGGAVYLIAGNRIDITGPGINAAGEGGDSGKGGPIATPNASGAGGGGTGGMIGFDAPTIANNNNSLLLANGGAGGEGSGVTTDGDPGDDPSTTAAAIGGTASSQIGGDGGNGSSGPATGAGANGKNGADGSSNAGNDGGGGGGGGGAGLIKGPAASLGNNVSPAPTP
ncbi:MAG TPA: hypothetical protein VHN14_15210 [Kofleriaceae bacterium]|jgi:hypothetical protein|nr:hypothetical protein [Kofleriaceae bacterium]